MLEPFWSSESQLSSKNKVSHYQPTPEMLLKKAKIDKIKNEKSINKSLAVKSIFSFFFGHEQRPGLTARAARSDGPGPAREGSSVQEWFLTGGQDGSDRCSGWFWTGGQDGASGRMVLVLGCLTVLDGANRC